MKKTLYEALSGCETDIDGAVSRCNDDEELYISLLALFPSDKTMTGLNMAITDRRWDDAFTAAHAMKGLAGNMGFVPLFHCMGELVILIRAGRIKEIDASFAQVKKCYQEILSIIQEELN